MMVEGITNGNGITRFLPIESIFYGKTKGETTNGFDSSGNGTY